MDQETDYFLTTFNKIGDNLFLGGLLGASNPTLISRHRITSIVSLLSPNAVVNKHRHLAYLELCIDDLPNQNIMRVVPEALAFIKSEIQRGGNVLIHCAAGVSRSASVAIAYFMVFNDLDYSAALAHVRKGRKCACPNQGFERQLRNMNIQSLKQFINK